MPALLQRTLLLAIFSSLSAMASAAELYKVEMLVFANESGIGINDEYWPEITPVDVSGAVFLRDWDGYPLQPFEALPENDLRLSADANRLARHSDYRVLYHRGWLQPIGGKQSARAVRIKTSRQGYELDGTITLYRNRFLHAYPTLQLSTLGPPSPPLPEAAEGSEYRPTAWLLQEARRMRSNEIHYIDHPRLGVLLIVRAVAN